MLSQFTLHFTARLSFEAGSLFADLSKQRVTSETVQLLLDLARDRGLERRIEVYGDSVSAESGYLRETVNLVFHIALIGVLVVTPWLVRQAEDNARRNGLVANARFEVANLFEAPSCARFGMAGGYDKLLIDPPRDGAVELVKSLEAGGPRRIVYVSCDPATLARDAEVLVHVKAYRLAAAGVINMFAHTSHVESIALFQK